MEGMPEWLPADAVAGLLPPSSDATTDATAGAAADAAAPAEPAPPAPPAEEDDRVFSPMGHDLVYAPVRRPPHRSDRAVPHAPLGPMPPAIPKRPGRAACSPCSLPAV